MSAWDSGTTGESNRGWTMERSGVETLGGATLNDEVVGFGESGRNCGTRSDLDSHGGMNTNKSEESTRR